ncbi:MAG: hypothetical protein GY711_09435 [bacterium]|nr:hypothetical protein [bacterium]
MRSLTPFVLPASFAMLSPLALAQTTMVDTYPGAFIDISGSGTALSISDDGEVDIVTTVTNCLWAPPGGVVRVGSNGGIRGTGPGLDLFAGNSPIPAAWGGPSNQSLLPFWDDMDTDAGNFGEIYWEEIAGTLIVQWNEAFFFPNDPIATFQVQVHSSGPALAQFVYLDIQGARPAGGTSATIGYQSGGVGNDFEWSFNTAGSVSNGTVLTLFNNIGVNYCDPAIPNSTGLPGHISASGSDVVAANCVTLIASDLPVGVFGIFIAGPGNGPFLPAASCGRFCLKGGDPTLLGRFNRPGEVFATGPSGTGSLEIDLTDIPIAGDNVGSPGPFEIALLPGDTWNFQAWYRELPGGPCPQLNNFTDALEVTFQ